MDITQTIAERMTKSSYEARSAERDLLAAELLRRMSDEELAEHFASSNKSFFSDALAKSITSNPNLLAQMMDNRLRTKKSAAKPTAQQRANARLKAHQDDLKRVR